MIPPNSEKFVEKRLKSIIKQLQNTTGTINIQVKSGIYVPNEDYVRDKAELEEQILDLQTMIVTGNYYTQIVDTDNQNILADDNYVLRADWKGVTT